jgi:hypothetical protein
MVTGVAGPSTYVEALAWTKVAITKGYYVPSVHFGERLRERGVNMLDIHNAFDRSVHAEPYAEGQPRNSGTCWRVIGPDCDGERVLGVGVEAWRSADRKSWITLCTVVII